MATSNYRIFQKLLVSQQCTIFIEEKINSSFLLHSTIAIDLRGYGNSSKPNGLSPYRLQNMIDDIDALLNILNRRTCILVCHDWGAIIGWEFIKQHSDRVSKYIMMGAPSSEIWSKSVASDRVQMLKSYYVYIFQMPVIPEYVLKFFDFNVLVNLYYRSRNWTKDDSDAFAYIYSRPGIYFQFFFCILAFLKLFFI